MKTSFYLILKYWRRHKKNLIALLFAGVLLTAVVFVTLMLNRERWARICHRVFDYNGHYDYIIAGSDDEIFSEFTAGKKGYNYGVIYVYGKIGTESKRFTYGAIDDEKNIMHIPLDEGRMPETETEIAASVKALNAWYWVGKCGDTITLDNNTYTVVGIIGDRYDNRFALDEELRPANLSSNGPFDSAYRIPSVFIGKSDEKPLYRIDLFNSFGSEYNRDVLIEIENRSGWSEHGHEDWIDLPEGEDDAVFFLMIAWIGSVIAVLSVYSILKTVFADRQSRIETLKKLGMSKRSVGCMYAVECAVFTLIQTVIGLAIGLGVYGGIFLFKTSVLREKPYSGFTDIRRAVEQSPDPFLFACVISFFVMTTAYVISALTSRTREKTPKNRKKPGSLFRCFGRIFRQKGVSVVQTVALTLICFSVIMGYMYSTESGKTSYGSVYHHAVKSYYAGGFNMETENIAEYYSCSTPAVNGIGHMDNDPYQAFPIAPVNYTAGIDDAIANQLPDSTLVTGNLTQTFIASDESKPYINEIDLSNEIVRQDLLLFCSEEYKNFFEEGQLGSKNMYRADTKLAPTRTIETLSENVKDGKINIDAINSGEEILVTYKGRTPPFKAGETVTVYSVGASENGFGIGTINSAEVKIGAILQISPNIGAVKSHTLLNDQDYNFLTTATGANAIGLHNARYTEIYAFEEMSGGVIPSSAEMTLQNLAKMKWETVKEKIISISGMLMILALMVLIGFAAYFNGIGMKIREKSFEISILRAVGTPVSTLRKRLLLGSIKIPVIASAISYGLIKSVQLIMEKTARYMKNFIEYSMANGGITISNGGTDYENDIVNFLKDRLFLNKGMWMINAELSSLILFAVICAVTFILTAAALKKFKHDIAFDLNSGRARQ